VEPAGYSASHRVSGSVVLRRVLPVAVVAGVVSGRGGPEEQRRRSDIGFIGRVLEDVFGLKPSGTPPRDNALKRAFGYYPLEETWAEYPVGSNPPFAVVYSSKPVALLGAVQGPAYTTRQKGLFAARFVAPGWSASPRWELRRLEDPVVKKAGLFPQHKARLDQLQGTTPPVRTLLVWRAITDPPYGATDALLTLLGAQHIPIVGSMPGCVCVAAPIAQVRELGVSAEWMVAAEGRLGW
jgi:hypothetical protein